MLQARGAGHWHELGQEGGTCTGRPTRWSWCVSESAVTANLLKQLHTPLHLQQAVNRCTPVKESVLHCVCHPVGVCSNLISSHCVRRGWGERGGSWTHGKAEQQIMAWVVGCNSMCLGHIKFGTPVSCPFLLQPA